MPEYYDMMKMKFQPTQLFILGLQVLHLLWRKST